MGCDIHGWVEKKVDGKWIGIQELKNTDRNYKRFAALAGVRDYEKTSDAEPKGIPDDLSETVAYHIKQFGIDGHSHSHLPLYEAAEIFLKTEGNPTEFERLYPVYHYFEIEDTDIANYRLVFWFDN